QSRELLRSRGFQAMGKAQGLSSLLAAIAHDQPVVMVGLDDTNASVRGRLVPRDSHTHGVQALVTADPSVAATLPRHALVSDRFGVRVVVDVAHLPALPGIARAAERLDHSE